MPEPTVDNSTTGVKTSGTEEKVTIDGREFPDYKTAAESLSHSHKEIQSTLGKKQTEWDTEKGTLTTKLQESEDALTEVEREKQANIDAKAAEEGQPEIDWDNPTASVNKLIKTAIDSALTVERERVATANLSTEQKAIKKSIDAEISSAVAQFPEIADPKIEKRLQTEVFLGLNPDKAGDFLTQDLSKFPEAVKMAGGNRIKLGYLYLLKKDGTLEDALKSKTTPDNTSFMEGGSKGSPPKSKMTGEEFDKLTPAQQREYNEKDADERARV